MFSADLAFRGQPFAFRDDTARDDDTRVLVHPMGQHVLIYMFGNWGYAPFNARIIVELYDELKFAYVSDMKVEFTNHFWGCEQHIDNNEALISTLKKNKFSVLDTETDSIWYKLVQEGNSFRFDEGALDRLFALLFPGYTYDTRTDPELLRKRTAKELVSYYLSMGLTKKRAKATAVYRMNWKNDLDELMQYFEDHSNITTMVYVLSHYRDNGPYEEVDYNYVEDVMSSSPTKYKFLTDEYKTYLTTRPQIFPFGPYDCMPGDDSFKVFMSRLYSLLRQHDKYTDKFPTENGFHLQ